MEDDVHPLRRYRLKAGKTLDQIARDVGASKATLSRIEQRKLLPSMDLVSRLKSITGLSADEFLPKSVCVTASRKHLQFHEYRGGGAVCVTSRADFSTRPPRPPSRRRPISPNG